MACCGKGNRSAPPRHVPAPAPAQVSRAFTPPPRAIPEPKAPPGSFNPPGKFCPKCGWIVAVTKYADPITHALVEKRSCTNRRCIEHR